MKHNRIIRFGLIGIFNTALDVSLYTLLVHIGLMFFFANLLSTTIAMAVSFTLNRKLTFASSGNKSRQIVLFFIFTASGLWLLQPVIITIVSHILNSYALSDPWRILIPKLVAVGASLVWNYLWYSTVVFKDRTNDAKNAV